MLVAGGSGMWCLHREQGMFFLSFLPEPEHLSLKLWKQQSPAHPVSCEGRPSQKSLVRDPGGSLHWDMDRNSGVPSLPIL